MRWWMPTPSRMTVKSTIAMPAIRRALGWNPVTETGPPSSQPRRVHRLLQARKRRGVDDPALAQAVHPVHGRIADALLGPQAQAAADDDTVAVLANLGQRGLDHFFAACHFLEVGAVVGGRREAAASGG